MRNKKKVNWSGGTLVIRKKVWQHGTLVEDQYIEGGQRPIRGEPVDSIPSGCKEYQHVYQHGVPGYIVDTVYFDDDGLAYVFDDENGAVYKVLPFRGQWILSDRIR